MLAGHCFWAGGDGVVLGSRLVAWASRHCLWSGKDRMSDHRGDTPNLGGPGGAVGIGQMPRVGSQFASYRIEGVLGRGGMSVVYRAENMRLGNEVALKVLSADLSEDDAFRERFVRESRLAASINHPNIIPIYDAGEQDGLLYIAMRYVEGCDLKTLIREQGPLSLPRAAAIISQVARGLAVAHQRGLIHRDIKPANILTERAGGEREVLDHAYLADFGLMKHMISRSGLTNTGQFLGTVDYVAPEQVEARDVDHRADIYSLGCVLYECLTGSVPYPHDADVAVLFAHVRDEVPRVTDVRPDLPPVVDEITSTAMAKRPDDRYSNAADIPGVLAAAVAGSAAAAPPAQPAPPRPQETGERSDVVSAAPPEPAGGGRLPAGDGPDAPSMPPRGRRSLVVPALAAALIAALAVIGVLLLSGDDSSPSAAQGGSNSSSNGGGAPGSGGAQTGGQSAGLGTTVQPSDLKLVMPTALYSHCNSGPGPTSAIATLDCTAATPAGLTYQISLFPDTATLEAAYRPILTAQGIEPDSNGCKARKWRGERVWLHPTGSVGGHVACYVDLNGDSVLVWTHERTNTKGVPPQPDHRDILGVARQHTQLPGELLSWWKFWSGTRGTRSIIGKGAAAPQ
jgi:serine/threonine protein kinase